MQSCPYLRKSRNNLGVGQQVTRGRYVANKTPFSPRMESAGGVWVKRLVL